MKNIGSIIAVYYALASDIASISSPDENGAVQVNFNSGKSFSQFVFTQESASFSEEQQDNDAGPYFALGLSFKCPRIGTIQHAIIRNLIDQDLIVTATDGNSTSILMGTLETPARIGVKMLRPQPASGYNGYEVSFRSNCLEPAPFLDESFVLS